MYFPNFYFVLEFVISWKMVKILMTDPAFRNDICDQFLNPRSVHNFFFTLFTDLGKTGSWRINAHSVLLAAENTSWHP